MVNAFTLRETVALPKQPGAYVFRDAEGESLYVGQAKSLRSRLESYFCKDRRREIRTTFLLRATWSIERIILRSEAEALGQKDRLVQQIVPTYNILLRDTKSKPHVKLMVLAEDAQVSVVRRAGDQATCLGPLFPAGLVHRALRLILRHFLHPAIPGSTKRNESGG